MPEIPKAYEPQSVEDKWYAFWVKQGCFTADPARVSEKRPAYSIVIPPPNVTGMLHMGHVLNNTIQDILSRKARMDGKEVLWLPGTDHAGISTEGMVEKQIRKEEKKSKREIGREEFLKRVWAWREKHGGVILQQLKKLGCSCDWTRLRFTMDEDYVKCVRKVFVESYKKGLIYRGKRMINWCPATQTALSDEEVEMKPQKGFMYHFKVQVAEVVGQTSRLSSGTDKFSGDSQQQNIGRDALGSDRQDACPTTGSVHLTDIWLTIATTRPETIPGDTAVAVNPKDPRYAHLIGKHIVRPLPIHLPTEQKLIPIIGDEHVDFEFGTGVLKVTPAHDKADFEIGQRHKLPIVDIMNPDGTMNDLAGESLAGLDRFEARSIAVERLKELGVLVEEKPYENNVGFSQRADVPIEPRLSEQWFLKYPAVEQSKACVELEGSTPAPGVAARALAGSTGGVVEAGDVKSSGRSGVADGASAAAPGAGALPVKMRFHPQRWAKVYDHWLTNIQDWCISRQLWWGHRIPVWRLADDACTKDQFFAIVEFAKSLKESGRDDLVIRWPETGKTFEGPDGKELKGITAEFCLAPSAKDIEAKLPGFGFTQDPDVLDTWFSSWLWPFATMGWPENTETLKKFYPTTDLVTGPDIIFFWVARMIMAGYEYMGEMPFKNVYFTGIIRDKQGRKMSKTLGNSPDPLVLIAQYGADALRFGTMRSAPLGQDVLFDEKDVELGRNFCNKLWNACRFRQMAGSAGVSPAVSGGSPETSEVQGEINPALLTSDDKWILLRLDQAIREIDTAFAEYKFSDATAALYRFFWSEYCDWYVEASKAALGSAAASAAPVSAPLAGTSAPSDVEREARSTAPGAGALPLRANKLAVIDFVLSHTLRLFHPFLPFITEELWHGMGYSTDMPEDQGGRTIMNAPWPKPFDEEEKAFYGLSPETEREVDSRNSFVVQIRKLRTNTGIPSNKRIRLVYHHANRGTPDSEWAVIQQLAEIETIEFRSEYHPAKGEPVIHPPFGGKLFLPLAGQIDIAAEKSRLGRELEKIRAEIAKVEAKLSNPNFTEKVPPKVLEEHRQRLADWQVKEKQAAAALQNLPE